ncbi:choice-of-anchor V domain-containing protein [Nonlabens sp.]|uniref:choice-of-anchor V domain-containing protein n=1 Tax=Nonlabens sp. TaxID=1888209 RepID=UPI001BCE6E6E|nr:choice-of-anchor V domain-containing protein [Nonlabens sp.]
MKKNYSFYSVLTAIPVALLILVSFSSGQPASFSGSPGDAGNTCTNCHAPGATHNGTPSLTSVPAAYIAGQTYDMNLMINGSSVSKFGFNITAEVAGGTKVGSWTAGAGTQLRNGGTGLTHTSAGNTSNNWTLRWTAPASDQGPVTFYYATLQANNNGANSGDQMINGQSSAVLTNADELISSFKLFPTHVVNDVTIELANSEEAALTIYNMNGQPVLQRSIERQTQIDVTSLSTGIYISQVIVGDKVSTQKFIKK